MMFNGKCGHGVKQYSKPKVIRRWLAGEAAGDIARDIGYRRDYVLRILQAELENKNADYSVFGKLRHLPVTEKILAQELREQG
jgi:hypothetical protein